MYKDRQSQGDKVLSQEGNNPDLKLKSLIKNKCKRISID